MNKALLLASSWARRDGAAMALGGMLFLAMLLLSDASHQATHGHAATGMANDPASGWMMWTMMAVAMAPLMALSQARFIWLGSLRRRRLSSVAGFLIVYVLVWAMAAWTVSSLVAERGGSAWAIALAALVAGWHCSPARQRLLNACHRLPHLRAFGPGSLGDPAAFGARLGIICFLSCGPLMLAAAASDHGVLAMALAMAVMAVERRLAPRRPRWRLPFVAERTAAIADWPPPPVGLAGRPSAWPADRVAALAR